MTPHNWFIEQRTAYATRVLDRSEERSFEDHLVRCADCRHAVSEIERDLGWLAMGVQPASPPPGFRWRAAAGALGTRPRMHRMVWLSLAAAAALIVTAGALVLQSRRREPALAAELAHSQNALVALQDTVAVLRQAARILQASIAMDDSQGALLIFADDKTHRWNVMLHGLPPAPAGEKYQFWFITADGMVRGTELRPTGDGALMVTLGMPPAGGAVIGAALSLEAMASVGNVPQGKQLAHLML